jgi:predicted HicB family RNase H-like nuclease
MINPEVETRSERVSGRIKPSLYARAEKEAVARKWSLSDLIEFALEKVCGK